MFRSCDFIEDFTGCCGPDERLGVCVVVVQVTIDTLFEFGDTVEDTASDGVLGDETEEALDLIEP